MRRTFAVARRGSAGSGARMRRGDTNADTRCVNAMKTLELNIAWCKGCGICAAFCPKGVLEVKHGKITIPGREKCIACGMCESLCPDFAIYLLEKEGEKGA